jgi:hypothetical protein
MVPRTYLISALWIFLVAVTGSDLFARMTIAGQSLGDAMGTHLQWAVVTIPGIMFLLGPFVGIALICRYASKRVRVRSINKLFGISMIILTAFYFNGFQAAQQGSMEDGWAAATPWFGPLSFFIGIPMLVVCAIIPPILVRVDRRPPK